MVEGSVHAPRSTSHQTAAPLRRVSVSLLWGWGFSLRAGRSTAATSGQYPRWTIRCTVSTAVARTGSSISSTRGTFTIARSSVTTAAMTSKAAMPTAAAAHLSGSVASRDTASSRDTRGRRPPLRGPVEVRSCRMPGAPWRRKRVCSWRAASCEPGSVTATPAAAAARSLSGRTASRWRSRQASRAAAGQASYRGRTASACWARVRAACQSGATTASRTPTTALQGCPRKASLRSSAGGGCTSPS
mmetsp:Transcript_5455/g.15186  ORF Transcript_5455/g.15186 Transcript_5455/m.15186 type:complete len:245 (+) Transcript_5455:2457-3191(+)